MNSKSFPIQLKGNDKDWKKKPWDFTDTVAVMDVLCVMWVDQGPVRLLTTKHEVNDEEVVIKLRRKPRETSLNAANVRVAFGEESRKELPIPVIINDYNRYKVGVDLCDQFCSYYSPNIRCFRNWLALFFFLLEVCAINSFLIAIPV